MASVVQHSSLGATAAVHRAIAMVRRLSDVFQHRRQQLAQGAGITETEWRVLDEISSEQFIPSLFARSRESTPAAVSKITRQLLDKGLVSVSVAKEDGRQRRYVLTAKGRRVMARLLESREAAIRDVWLDLDAGDVRRFAEIGEQLTSRLESYAEMTASTDRRNR